MGDMYNGGAAWSVQNHLQLHRVQDQSFLLKTLYLKKKVSDN